MRKTRNHLKQGAASFFIVALSTMILMILAASFAAIIVSNMTRTSNDELSQSAYDAAMAGVEDAKMAFANYKNCLQNGVTTSSGLSSGTTVTCQDIIYWMEHPDCDMVAHMIGRLGKTATGEVTLGSSTSNGRTMNQAYTCVMLTDEQSDYRASISSSGSEKLVRVQLKGVDANQIAKVRLKWHNQSQEGSNNFSNYWYNKHVEFRPANQGSGASWGVSTPPTLQVQLIQTDKTTFKLDHFTKSRNGSTDRAVMYIVPTNKTNIIKGFNQPSLKPGMGGVFKDEKDEKDEKNRSWQTYVTVANYGGGANADGSLKVNNIITRSNVASTNFDDTNINSTPQSTGSDLLIDKIPSVNGEGRKHLPFLAYCNGTGGYACSVDIELPTPVKAGGGAGGKGNIGEDTSDGVVGGGDRSNDTFTFVISVPYGQPDTDFLMEFYCDTGKKCAEGSGEAESEEETRATLKGVQVSVDATGRANDLYRRIETRLEASDADFNFSSYGIQLLDTNDNSNNLTKSFYVTSEWGHYGY